MKLVLAIAVSANLIAFDALAADNIPPPGFTALFNGQDLTGWKGLVADPPARARMSPEELARAQAKADERMREHWKVAEGSFVFDGSGDSICTGKDYGDFELLVDWKILKDGDSGIYLRGSPQVQIWDRPEGSGGLYNNEKNPAKPLVKADRAIGEWNSFRIRMVGEKVTVHLNGVPVVRDTVMENYWERSRPIYPAGQIELQNHGNTLWFKNIFIREIPAGEAASVDGVLHVGARVAVAGDSITEQKLYSRFIEDYLLACRSDLDLKVLQLGWGGEQAGGFAARMANDLFPWKPDVVTTCYGMNDGRYRAYEPPIGEAYERAMADIVQRLKSAGATVVVGSPGVVDSTYFRNPSTPPDVYNENLARLGEIARKLAGAQGMPFADVHGPMMAAMERAKAALGKEYDVGGTDGVHPRANGHLVMAFAFLKGLGLDGDLGSFTIDLKGGATAGPCHEVLSAGGGKAAFRSRRYPFCFWGDEKAADGTRSILPFVPFQAELNRFTLIVRGLESPRARVTWGEGSKVFSREDLALGVNLAAEFPENPFSAAFRAVDEAVARKQSYETSMIKGAITQFRSIGGLLGDDPEAKKALDVLRARLADRHDKLHAEVRAKVVPVEHSIEVKPE